MQTTKQHRFGSFTAILAGILLFLAIGTYLFWAEKRSAMPTDYFNFILYQGTLFHITLLLLIAFALVGAAVVLALEEALGQNGAGARWVNFLALLGLAVLALNSSFLQTEMSGLAASYLAQKDSFTGFGYSPFMDEQGAIWLRVVPGGPVDQAGIQTGDQLLALNGEPVTGKTATQVVAITRQAVSNGSLLTYRVQTPGQAERDVQVSSGTVSIFETGVQQTMEEIGGPDLDPNYLFSFGLLGVWLVARNWQARKTFFRGALAWAGIAAGVAFLLFVLGMTISIPLLVSVTMLAGMVLAPIWFVWTGLRLR